MEPSGGTYSGLEAASRRDMKVNRHRYADTSDVARKAAWWRMQQSQAQLPGSFPLEAPRGAFTTLSQNVHSINMQVLLSAGVQDGAQWMLTAGFERQGLSPARLIAHPSTPWQMLERCTTTTRAQARKAYPPAAEGHWPTCVH